MFVCFFNYVFAVSLVLTHLLFVSICVQCVCCFLSFFCVIKCNTKLQAPWRIAAGEEDFCRLETNVQLNFAGWNGLLNTEAMEDLQNRVEVQFQSMNLLIWDKLEVFWRVTHDEVAGPAAAGSASAVA